MKNAIRNKLTGYRRKTIELSELEAMLDNINLPYDQFASLILSLEVDGVIEMVRAKGRNTRNPSLAYTYRIHAHRLKQDLHNELIKYRLLLHSSIQLDTYFSGEPSVWEDDLPYIMKIHRYIEENGFPEYEAPAPERSVDLVGDEKWITDKHGEELLKRIGLWTHMKVIPVADPLMYAINPKALCREKQLHLIVENKTTFQGLLDALPMTMFTTLIYGSGNKIIKSIEQFDRQLPLPDAEHIFYYFGDIDRSGIFIWYILNQKVPVQLYMPFYTACMTKGSLLGKTNQRSDKEAIEQFLSFFSKEEEIRLQAILDNGQYFPQEVLRTNELQEIWRQHHGS
ncbi:hypothetical protein AM500_18360 [Bacillus sp. FJAT-18017]|uniref:Wadjet anti-phage system protein JetD domain-containing protein n=1 Tax=Bacillus sp. FJAT-18017 TaxID=1705566 RepID=UPI0006BC2AFA|nr:Wadjet anti-phage system protein JetD domain-containing protein [Bacillus sp. FJAT-18017]ALC91528.1 hypothetical protein AM500_18360 [Bacillus sp. FJAT-18017]